MEKTNQQYDALWKHCRKVFSNKMNDYGTAWRILGLNRLQIRFILRRAESEVLKKKEFQKWMKVFALNLLVL
jgi:hypothetical protein